MSFALPQDRRTNQNLSNYRLIYFAQDGANRHFFITELYNLTNCSIVGARLPVILGGLRSLERAFWNGSRVV